jgi:hypothetical protein
VSADLVHKVQTEGEELLQHWRAAAAPQEGLPH